MTIDLPLPLWPRQQECLRSEANEQLFGGASEGGKSYLARVGIILAGLECPGIKMTLIRKKSSDILENHLRGNKSFAELLAPLTRAGVVDLTQQGIRFPREATCTFKHCQDERQFDSAQGNESQVLVLDEAPQIEERLLRAFRAWCRITNDQRAKLPPFWQKKLPWILYTGNPIGQSAGYFRRQFVKAREAFQIEDVDGFRRQYVPSKVEDNRSVDIQTHRLRLAGIGDAGLAKALDEGDWDAMIGDFFPEWDEVRHVVLDFDPPAHWYRYRVFDWGVADPAYCAWVAVSDGEPFRDRDGRQRWFPRGAIIIYDEWYICDPDDPSKGARLSNRDMARGIVERSDVNFQTTITLTDTKPFQSTGGYGPAQEFADNGVVLDLGDTARVAGWSQMRSRLIGIEWTLDNEGNMRRLPMIYVCARCRYARDYIPALQRHPSEKKKEDAQEHGEATHVNDPIRYACMAHNHAVIKDHLGPIQAKLERALKLDKPTVKRMLEEQGHGYFN